MRFKVLNGFRDWFPEDLATRRWIEAAWQGASRNAGFEEIDGPILEPLELFTAKSGDEIVGELYNFEDKGGRAVALRPEMTPSLARMVGARAGALPKPIKWFCTPEFFRYQRPQRGRLRAFQQWNVDVVGSAEPASDAEAISVAIDALRRLGLADSDFRVRINDRRFIRRMLASLDIGDADEPAVLAIVDKLDRDDDAPRRLREMLGDTRANELLGWCEQMPLDRADELTPIFDACADYGVADCLEPDFRIVRGLAYYTGCVWEIFDANRELRALAGGGRYDDLISTMGGPDLPALGFGMGDAVLGELLKVKNLMPEAPARVDVFVIPIGEEMLGPARQVATRLRARGVSAEAPYTARNPSKALRAASVARARRVVFVGPDEWKEGMVRVKDLGSGEERDVKFEDLD